MFPNSRSNRSYLMFPSYLMSRLNLKFHWNHWFLKIR
jgi:hypothetical protein